MAANLSGTVNDSVDNLDRYSFQKHTFGSSWNLGRPSRPVIECIWIRFISWNFRCYLKFKLVTSEHHQEQSHGLKSTCWPAVTHSSFWFVPLGCLALAALATAHGDNLRQPSRFCGTSVPSHLAIGSVLSTREEQRANSPSHHVRGPSTTPSHHARNASEDDLEKGAACSKPWKGNW